MGRQINWPEKKLFVIVVPGEFASGGDNGGTRVADDLTGVQSCWNVDYFDEGEVVVEDGVIADLKRDQKDDPNYHHRREP